MRYLSIVLALLAAVASSVCAEVQPPSYGPDYLDVATTPIGELLAQQDEDGVRMSPEAPPPVEALRELVVPLEPASLETGQPIVDDLTVEHLVQPEPTEATQTVTEPLPVVAETSEPEGVTAVAPRPPASDALSEQIGNLLAQLAEQQEAIRRRDEKAERDSRELVSLRRQLADKETALAVEHGKVGSMEIEIKGLNAARAAMDSQLTGIGKSYSDIADRVRAMEGDLGKALRPKPWYENPTTPWALVILLALTLAWYAMKRRHAEEENRELSETIGGLRELVRDKDGLNGDLQAANAGLRNDIALLRQRVTELEALPRDEDQLKRLCSENQKLAELLLSAQLGNGATDEAVLELRLLVADYVRDVQEKEQRIHDLEESLRSVREANERLWSENSHLKSMTSPPPTQT